MRVKDLIEKNDWKDIEKEFLKIFPDQKNIIAGFKKVFSELSTLVPEKTNFTKLILKRIKESDDEFSDWHQVDIFAQDGITANDYHADKLEKFALEFTLWEEILSLEIDEETLKNFSEIEIISHLLNEVTFFGFDQKTIGKQLEELDKRVEESKNPETKWLTMEEAFEKIQGKINEKKSSENNAT